jgi:hypothetical protein
MREGEGWSVCGAPLGLGESIGFWGDALEPVYALRLAVDSFSKRFQFADENRPKYRFRSLPRGSGGPMPADPRSSSVERLTWQQ